MLPPTLVVVGVGVESMTMQKNIETSTEYFANVVLSQCFSTEIPRNLYVSYFSLEYKEVLS